MIGIIGIIAFLTVLALSLVVTRIATIALTYTGLSTEAARFQARSAFTGTGFTTSEAEKVVDHPVRRRIIMMLMVTRSAGLITIVMSLILSLAGENGSNRLMRLGWVVGGSALLWLVAQSAYLDDLMSRLIKRALERWTQLDVRDYAGLLKISSNYSVTEFRVRDGDWLAGKQLSDCRLPDEGVTVLGIYRGDGRYVGVPRRDSKVHAGDTLVLYGRTKAIKDLTTRRAGKNGEKAHERAVDEQRRRDVAQQHKDRYYFRKKSST